MALAGVRLDPGVAFTSGLRVGGAEASQFQPFVGDAFSIYPAGASRVRVRLAKLAERPLTGNVAQFSLVFHGPSDQPLHDGIHEFGHPALGSFSIFISSFGAPVDGRRAYQACFSRHVRT